MEHIGTMQESVTAVPEGEYEAELANFTEELSTHGPVNKFEFRLIGGSGIDGRKVTGLTPKYMADNTKKGRWVAALLGRMPHLGENPPVSEILNKRCRVVIAHKTGDKGQVFANVAEVLPPSAPDEEDLTF